MKKNITGYYLPAVIKALFDAASTPPEREGMSAQAKESLLGLFRSIRSPSLHQVELYLAPMMDSGEIFIDYYEGKKLSLKVTKNCIDLSIYLREYGAEAVENAFATIDAIPREDHVHLRGCVR